MDKATWQLIEERYATYRKAWGRRVKPSDFDRIMRPFASYIDPDYREFVLRYGAGLVGASAVYGLRKVDWVGKYFGKGTAPGITKLLHKKKCPGAMNWFVFSENNGGPVGFEKDRTVWLYDMDFGQIVQLASGFEDYLLKWCLHTRAVEDYPAGGTAGPAS